MTLSRQSFQRCSRRSCMVQRPAFAHRAQFLGQGPPLHQTRIRQGIRCHHMRAFHGQVQQMHHHRSMHHDSPRKHVRKHRRCAVGSVSCPQRRSPRSSSPHHHVRLVTIAARRPSSPLLRLTEQARRPSCCNQGDRPPVCIHLHRLCVCDIAS